MTSGTACATSPSSATTGLRQTGSTRSRTLTTSIRRIGVRTTTQAIFAGGASAPSSIWSFAYEKPCSRLADAATGAGHTLAANDGCTTLTSPRQQSTGKFVRTYYDKLGRMIEKVDAF